MFKELQKLKLNGSLKAGWRNIDDDDDYDDDDDDDKEEEE